MPIAVVLPSFCGVFARDPLKIGEKQGIYKDFIPDLENKRERIHKQQEYAVENAAKHGNVP